MKILVIAFIGILFTSGTLAGDPKNPPAGGKSGAGETPAWTLPFTVKATEEKLEKPPAFMGGADSGGMDFPYCPVMMDGEYWILYKSGMGSKVFRFKGTNIENAVRQPDGDARINTSSGGTAYMLGGMWYDAAEKELYAPLHNEVAGWHFREIHLASSTDKGLTWKYEGALLTSDEDPRLRRRACDLSGLFYEAGEGDFVIYVDERGGYIYLFTLHTILPKIEPGEGFMRHHVARCAISDKMAPGKWKKFYNGAWSEPGIGGKASYVNGYIVTYNTYLKKYLSFNYGSGLSVCDDLSKQDWSPSFYIGKYWGYLPDLRAWWPTSEAKNDVSTSGQNMYVYISWEGYPGHRVRLEFGPGQTAPDRGFASPSACWKIPPAAIYWGATMETYDQYGYTPLFESTDPIEARRTRRVGCAGAETRYAGKWTDAPDPAWYEGLSKASSEPGASIEFTFKGKDIYWRTVKGPDCGKADVYLDGVLQTTADCWASIPTHVYFAFIKRGLSDGEHTFKAVVKGEKNPLSTGVVVKHMLFEYAAESYRASDCFTGTSGKNQWYNQERHGTAFVDMTFREPVWKGSDVSEVGFFHMAPGSGDAVRKWVAPHDGTIRIEGVPAIAGTNAEGVVVMVLKNTEQAWLARLATPDAPKASYDTAVAVKSGDALAFVVQAYAPAKAEIGVLLNGYPSGKEIPVQLNTRDGKALKIGDKEFTRGLACHAVSKIVVRLPGPGKMFSAVVGVDANNSPEPKGSVVFSVIVAGKEAFKPVGASGKKEGIPVTADLGGASGFILEVADAWNGIDGDWADWADAKVVLADGKELWLSDLPLRNRQKEKPPQVLWDPVVTYVNDSKP